MSVQVGFNYAAWVARYSEFAYVPQALAQDFFNEATLYHDNNGGGPVTNATQQLLLLGMLTAHIAKMNAPTANGAPAPDTVGRVSNASEGSVSVALEYQATPGSEQWYAQTKYGAAYWAATRQFRTMRYRRGFVRPVNPFFFR